MTTSARISTREVLGWTLGVAFAALASGCGGESGALSSQTQAEHATADDQMETQLFRVKDPNGQLIPVLNTRGHGYVLECPNMAGLERLISATGFNLAMLGFTPIYTVGSAEHRDLAEPTGYLENPRLSCLSGADRRNKFYKFEYNGQGGAYQPGDQGKITRNFAFFGNEDADGRRVLHNLGCQELIVALGFDPAKAVAIPVEMKEEYNLEDDFDIHCLGGMVPGLPNAGIEWLTVDKLTQQVRFGEAIDPVTLEASVKNAAGKRLRYRLLDSPRPPAWLKLAGSVLSGSLPLSEGPGPKSYEAQVVAELEEGGAVSAPLSIRISGTCPRPIYRERSNAAECGIRRFRSGKDPFCGIESRHPLILTAFDADRESGYTCSLTIDNTPRYRYAPCDPFAADLTGAACRAYGFDGAEITAIPGGFPGDWVGSCTTTARCEYFPFGVDSYFTCRLPAFGLEGCEAPDGIPEASYAFGAALNGTEYRAFDLLPSQAEPQFCRARCTLEPRCKGFTYVTAGVEAVNPRCHLLEAVSGRQKANAKVAGVVRESVPEEPLEWRTNRQGYDVQQGLPLEAADPRLCQKACKDNPVCRAFTYVRPTLGQPAMCWLKNSVPYATVCEDCVSGLIKR